MATPSSSVPSSSIQIELRKDRAFSTGFLQSFIKPFGTSLVKPGRPLPAGPPELTPHESVYKHCNVRQREISYIRVYDINVRSRHTKEMLTDPNGYNKGEYEARVAAKEDYRHNLSLDPTPSHTGHDIISQDFAKTHSGRKKQRHIYYFPGGGFQSPATKEHWKLCAHLAMEGTKGNTTTTVSIVSYPLAPHSPARMSMDALQQLYYKVLNAVSPSPQDEEDEFAPRPVLPQDEEIIFAGDSAGGNVALALTLHMLSSDPRAPAPYSLLLISPAVDLRNINPEQQLVAKKDPILTMSLVEANAKAWCSTAYELSDPLVSPILGNLAILAKRHVIVNGVIGLYDVLAPDAVLLTKKLMEVGVKGRWLEWDKQMHCFPLAFSYGSNEGKEAVKWIQDVLDSSR